MKVFIGWSGQMSKAVALALKGWLPYVINAVDPWMSDIDIGKGTPWMDKLRRQLEATQVGIICLTPENLQAPWVLFEAGALSKKLDYRTLVCPYLFEVAQTGLKEPLVHFQSTNADKEDTRKLLVTINKALRNRALTEILLDNAFERQWPFLENMLKAIPRTTSEAPPRRSDREILEEVLDLARTQARQRLGSSATQHEDEPITWSQLLGAMQSGPRLLKENLRQNLNPLRNTGGPELAMVLTKVEKDAAVIDAKWHELASECEALHRRIDLLTPQGQENPQPTLMWMAERGTREDLPLLRFVGNTPSPSIQAAEKLFELAERRIAGRSA
jgi:hypothetical protein